jgi:O-antigen/teichoic acid export membrane protein
MAAGVQAVRPTGDLSRLLRLALLGLPLGGTTLLVSLHSNFPRYFIAEEYELGIFSAIAALMTAGTMVFRALDQSSSPRLARLSHAGDSRSFRQLFIKVMLLYVGFGLLGILAAAVAGEWLLALMFQPEYAAYPDVLLWVMVAACLSYIMGALMTAMIAARKLRPLFPMLCLTATASLIFCWWLVPLFGMTGAAQAIALSKLPFVMIGFVVVWRMTRPSAESPQCGSALDPISEAPAEGRPQRCAG